MNYQDPTVLPPVDRERHASNDSDGALSRVFNDVSDLLRSELSLVKAEVSQSVTDAKTGAASMAFGVAILIPGIMLLIASSALALAAFTGLELWSSTLIIGAAVSVIGMILLLTAKSKLSAENMKPTRTQAMLEKDKKMVERKLT